MEIIELFKTKMGKVGMSQRKLAHLTGIHFNSIWKIFNGRVKPTIDTVDKIATALEIEIIIGGRNDED